MQIRFARSLAFLLPLALIATLGALGPVQADEDPKAPEKAKPGPNGKQPNPKKAPPKPKAPETIGLAKLGEQLDALRARVEKLAEEANKTPEMRLVEKYERYTAVEFKQKKRVRAKDLIEFALELEGAGNQTTREKIVEVLERVRRKFLDPDLSAERKGSRSSPRASLALKIVPSLKDKNKWVRYFADKLLKALWSNTTLPGINAYNHAPAGKGTWGDAISEWKKHLKRR